ncbi:type IV toxin-antitoxin system AbiEi family antitoxin [Hydrotalea sp.]|uniref:type IV toxin-antitoxin system AbiEi family antitoxin domain-containing protein n=1 Tax=Hydrotalea sp. TaxID=2881279 RepID=UPI00262E603D|nr:type IV toxin-antitoxin system AbiEi family antitoxin [Hydrotalea sp.]
MIIVNYTRVIFCKSYQKTIPFAKFYSLEVYLSISDWVENLASKGRHSFSLNEVRNAFVNDTEAAIKLKLTRMVGKKKIISIHKGYYLIITSQYASRGVLPPALFIDGLMKFLERPYYVGLLNAAAFHGAAHQQPQEYFVVTNFPALRPTGKKGIKINYISKKEVPELYLEKRKTETGSINISNPALTAIDLVQFDKRVGGLDRAATVLNELAEAIKKEQITEQFLREVPVAAIQRLGFLLEVILKKDIGNHFYEVSQKAGLDFFRIPLKTSAAKKGFPSDERWKVIVNTEIEIDE